VASVYCIFLGRGGPKPLILASAQSFLQELHAIFKENCSFFAVVGCLAPVQIIAWVQTPGEVIYLIVGPSKIRSSIIYFMLSRFP